MEKTRSTSREIEDLNLDLAHDTVNQRLQTSGLFTAGNAYTVEKRYESDLRSGNPEAEFFMADLYAGLLIMAVACLCILVATVRYTRSTTKVATTRIGFAAGLLMLLYLVFIWKTALLSAWLPFSSIVVLCNWFPLAAAFLAGITWTHGYGTKVRRVLFGSAVFLTAAWSMCDPLLGQPPVCVNRWDRNGVCRQSSKYTCTPAAAATLLRLNGISTEESEMADLCLTRDGTTWQGLFRGLTLKTQGHRSRVKVIECEWDELERQLHQPMIIAVGIDPSQPYPEAYTNKRWGWEPGVRHSVVLLGITNGRILVADPSVGLESWTAGDLQTLFRGRAVTLTPTDGRPG